MTRTCRFQHRSLREDRIIDNYARQGFQCVAERHLDESVNYAFGEVEEETVAEMVRAVAVQHPEAIVIMCTKPKDARLRWTWKWRQV